MGTAAALWATPVAQATALPDVRLSKRLAPVLGAFASGPRACGDWAGAKGPYRFWGDRRVTGECLLRGVCQHTATRAVVSPELLVLQDTPSANFGRLRGTAEPGPIDP